MGALTTLALIFLPGLAFAQSKPIIMLSRIPPQYSQLDTNEVEDDAPIELTWSADIASFQTYRFELTYDRARDPETMSDPMLVVLDDTPDAGRNMGVVVSGQTYRIRIRPSQIVRPEHLPDHDPPPPVDLDDQPETRDIVVQVFIPGQEGDDLSAASQAFPFQYDTRKPPAPRVFDVFPKENQVEVHWSAPEMAADVDKWEVVYCSDGSGAVETTTTSSTAGVNIVGLPCAEADRKTQIASLEKRFVDVSDGVSNGVPVAVAVRAIDDIGNRGDLSNAKLQTPAATTDFWELYRGLGGEEDGGFCFVATAAHGSYAHPVVKVLRLFRDQVLERSHFGSLFVWAYYRWSPPAAEALRHDAEASAYARAALLPIALAALLFTLLPLAGAAAIAWVLVRKLRARAALVAVLVMAPLSAEASELTRPDPEGVIGFGFEFKGGPYLPDMGRDAGSGGDSAFLRVFEDQGSNALFALALELQLFRLFGTAAVGASFGFMQWVGKGVFGFSMDKSRDTTVFNILPLTLVAVYRFDWLADRYPIPLVPYVKGGLAYYFWWITNSTGHVSRFRGDPTTDEDDLTGRGGKFGFTGTAGIAVMLNHLEPQAARSLHNTTGIRGTYFFGEVQAAKVDGFGGDGFDFSEVNWNLGMYFEF